ncbi:uncharacterized protein MEPE_06239 [Melanopsichium pennsylvanicum]|uniref:C2H2-type domain-containing protein n=2 Tax=Melanopsichium pennsylvanicum TaxID=63383 RepID=A0AAJ4XS36_9BASI|nr:fog: zn-finger [Melanopsichium pennsylvanicum 4]SNX87529.1 uncharacterized protein MEPE_06239 [Melanopsichium pennsylvanicum]
MAVAQRQDGVGQYGFSQHYSGMAPPTSIQSLGYDRRSKMEEQAEPIWPVPRVQQQAQQGSPASDRFTHGFSSQSDMPRQQAQQSSYTYDSASSATLRNPVVYSQPAQVPWSLSGQSANEYAGYPTASFMPPVGQRGLPPLHAQNAYPGSTNGAYGGSTFHAGSEIYPKVMNGSASAMSGAYDHTADTLWPLDPSSLDAFASIPAPSGQVARLTLTSATDKGKFKARSSLPPPKQFKCSACDAIFSRNHDLKRHARIHLAVKPFPCGYCDKAFSRKDALKRHVLVKGCGIGNKKQNDSRKRAATLSKLENSDGGSSSRAPYDGGSSDGRVRDYSSFRDDLHYQDQQGLQSAEGSNTRGFAGARIDATWQSVNDGSNSLNADQYGSRGEDRLQMQMPQSASLQSYQQQPHYPTFGMPGEDAFQQRQQLPGGLVNAFTSPEGSSASSPSDMKAHAATAGDGGPDGQESKHTSRPGSAKLANNTMPYGGPQQSFVDEAALGAADLGNDQSGGNGLGGFEGDMKRFGYQNQPPMMSPSQRQQQPFGTYFGHINP